MLGIGIVFAVVLGLGSMFLGVDRFGSPGVRRRAPWLIGAAVCIIATVAIATHDDGLGSLLHPIRKAHFRDMLLGGCVVAGMVVESVFISRWALANSRGKAGSYLAVFICCTLVAWFITMLALWPLVPGS